MWVPIVRTGPNGGHPQGVPLQIMRHDSDLPQRRSLRLPGYDYSQPGAYYFTVCVQDHKFLLGEVVLGQMNHNDAGLMVDRAWNSIPQQFPAADLDEHIVMPNHFHGVIRILGAPRLGAGGAVGAPLVGARNVDNGRQRATTRVAPTGTATFGEMVGAFKSITTDEYIRGVRELSWARFRGKLWQWNFYEHTIRDEVELERIRDYIRRNPLMWAIDRYNPDRAVPVIDEDGRVVPWEES